MFILNVLASFLGCSLTLGGAMLLVHYSRKKALSRMKGVNIKCKSK